MDIRQKVLNAFRNKETGLTKNPRILRKRNPELYAISDDLIRDILMQESGVFNRNSKVEKVKKYVNYRANFVGEILHADLMFINSPRNTNQIIEIEGKKYVLIVVDTYSRFLWVGLLDSKSSQTIASMLHQIVNSIREDYYGGNTSIYFKILTDAGKEFSTNLIQNKYIKHIISKNPRGAALAEAAILKIRTKIKYLEKDIRKLPVDDLRTIVGNINSESEADKIMNWQKMREENYKDELKDKAILDQGDYVRVAIKKGIFDKKSNLENFSDFILVVYDSVYDKESNVYQYILGSVDGRFISKRKFYKEELKEIPWTYMKNLPEEKQEKLSDFTKEEKKDLMLVEE